MIKPSHLIFIVLASLSSAPGVAQVDTQFFTPESGFYWNPDEPGRGFAIEIQDRTVFLTVYAYRNSAFSLRQPLWYSSSGTLREAGADRLHYVFDSELFLSQDGQCLGCPFQGEPFTDSTDQVISISFDTATTALLQIDQEEIPIQRFWYSPSIEDIDLALQGQWMIVTDCTASVNNNCYPSDEAIQPFEGDLLEFSSVSGSSQDRTTDGVRAGTTVEIAASYDSQDDLFVIVVAETNEEFLAYYFFGEDFGTNRFIGFSERYRPGRDLSGDAFPMQGYRLSDRTFARSGGAGKARSIDGEPRAKPRSRLQARGRQQGQSESEGARIKRVDVARLNRMLRRLEQHLVNTPGRESRR